MIKLINANITRLKKSKLFHVFSLSLIIVTLYLIFNQYLEYKKYHTLIEFDSLFSFFLIFIGLIIAIFTSLFLSTEKSENTIRNKIMVGHKRSTIYLANLITIIGVSLIFELIFLIILSAIGIPLFKFNLSSKSFFLYTIFTTQLIILVNVAIYTFIAHILNDASIINVVSLTIAFGSYFLTLALFNIIDAPEYISIAELKPETNNVEYQKEKNPKYPSATTLKIINNFMDIIIKY